MLRELVPASVAVSETFPGGGPDVGSGCPPATGRLFPEEAVLVRDAVAARRDEFVDGRTCARRALSALGVPEAPLLPYDRGCPRWPVGTLGSITHCAGYRAAAVATTAQVLALGVDAEPHAPTPDGILEAIARPEERERHRTLTRALPHVHWDRLLFSAKESVYKSWFPLTRRPLEFEDADIVLTPDAAGRPPGTGSFTARILVPAPTASDGRSLATLRGHWLIRAGLVVTAIAVPTTRPR
ncbi:4'-phosphopantetheinyl transferase family protein [Streptomyces sp. CA-210063]|uniref:4'-phosphopantetheinyl transferase family protein n=1 Tax=Streptomyces sp. CA-210063 TaxID=2801029 RepID=UPI003FA7E075